MKDKNNMENKTENPNFTISSIIRALLIIVVAAGMVSLAIELLVIRSDMNSLLTIETSSIPWLSPLKGLVKYIHPIGKPFIPFSIILIVVGIIWGAMKSKEFLFFLWITIFAIIFILR